MGPRLQFEMQTQPDDVTCGPTCLHAVYRYYGDEIDLADVVAQAPQLEGGGTLGVYLALHALRRGYKATIYTYNLQMFDPTWFVRKGPDVKERLRAQMKHKDDSKLHVASKAYIEFLEEGGRLRFEDLSRALLRATLNRGVPILTGLSATYLYRCAREIGSDNSPDDLRGEPSGHFVVLHGYNRLRRLVSVADPLQSNPIANSPFYEVQIDRLVCSILLGNFTYDANLVLLEPRQRAKRKE